MFPPGVNVLNFFLIERKLFAYVFYPLEEVDITLFQISLSHIVTLYVVSATDTNEFIKPKNDMHNHSDNKMTLVTTITHVITSFHRTGN